MRSMGSAEPMDFQRRVPEPTAQILMGSAEPMEPMLTESLTCANKAT